MHPATTLHRVLPCGLGAPDTACWPLFGSAPTRALEIAAQAKGPHPPLMARAGLALARLARACAPHAARTWVLAGPGNNGGDGLVAARWLHTGRHDVQVRLVGDPARLPPDASLALRAALAAGVSVQAFDAGEQPLLGPEDLLIDALLGLGASRAPEGNLARAIEQANAVNACVLAADLPSGLHPDTGALLGAQAVRADATLALLSIKPGCVTAEGRAHTGVLWWDDLGLGLHAAAGPADAWAPESEPTGWLATGLFCTGIRDAPGPSPLRRRDAHLRRHSGHKGHFGDVWALGGAAGMEGALVLAAHAALAAGAGRVHACALSARAAHGLATQPALMYRAPGAARTMTTPTQTVWLAGCGGGTAVAEHLPPLLAQARRLVLDADALNAVAARPALQDALSARQQGGLQTVLTPHPLEAARLLGTTTRAVQADRWAAVRALAQRYRAVAVLKGSGTLVCGPVGVPWANGSGNAALATAGTGDVLAGWLAGRWAQAPETAHPLQATLAVARAAVWQHGQAADAWQQAGYQGPVLASELILWLQSLPSACTARHAATQAGDGPVQVLPALSPDANGLPRR